MPAPQPKGFTTKSPLASGYKGRGMAPKPNYASFQKTLAGTKTLGMDPIRMAGAIDQYTVAPPGGEPDPSDPHTDWNGSGPSGPDPYEAVLQQIQAAATANSGAIDAATAQARQRIAGYLSDYNAQAAKQQGSTQNAYAAALAGVSAKAAPIQQDLTAQGFSNAPVAQALAAQQGALTSQNAAQGALMDRLSQVFNASFADRQAGTEQIAQGAKGNLAAEVQALIGQVASARSGGSGGGGGGSSSVTAGDASTLASADTDYRIQLLNDLGNLGMRSPIAKAVQAAGPDLRNLSTSLANLKTTAQARQAGGKPFQFKASKAVKQISKAAKGVTTKALQAQYAATQRGY